jgi:hypothetical protein
VLWIPQNRDDPGSNPGTDTSFCFFCSLDQLSSTTNHTRFSKSRIRVQQLQIATIINARDQYKYCHITTIMKNNKVLSRRPSQLVNALYIQVREHIARRDMARRLYYVRSFSLHHHLASDDDKYSAEGDGGLEFVS